ncbi:T9SS type B sorting domain-containing protein [Muricauda sp. JGD-17]|uniref:T9SS type B sorting domain-containing protein n=1 Tax=Flagellimonas ochracea TaxID=2696472 RepID=A0A964WVX3_9FLAO|nr:T9SS type B sorting domain-containing protein [Allomuricauda ochracea]NAY90370.1 T9SS type B sorting domain-containing protein [Allomuricauda ochracea]
MLFILAFGLYGFGSAQQCPALLSPTDGATGVPLNTTITWEFVDNVQAFIIELGTSPGASDILSPQFASGNSFTPPQGLPQNQEIFVTISLFFFDRPNVECFSRSFTTETITVAPNCTQMSNPMDMSVDVTPTTNISWEYAYGATGYIISLGTTAGGTDILNNLDVGNTLTYNPPDPLPSEDTIYVTITPYNNIGMPMGCSSQSFTTSAASPLPSCAQMVSPRNGEINVPLSPILEWTQVPGATGYRVTIGTTPNSADILDDNVFNSNSTPVINFEPNRTFFITVIPFNDTGDSIGCGQESFSTLLGCGPYLDFTTGEFVTLNPEIDFPDEISFCENEAPFTLTSTDVADGYRWYQVDQSGVESLISDTNQVILMENGNYRYEAYNIASQSGNTIECPATKEFKVVSSEIATIQRLRVESNGLNLQITVDATGNGNYEYAIDNENGPYQDSNVFRNVEPGTHIFFVRDKNGCGVVQEAFIQDLTVEGFPKFFTPNGDNINDFWQFIQPPNSDAIVLQSIRIFDRFGKFLEEISQDSQGWDGNFAGRPLPSGDYWFRAVDDTNREIMGHFSLKR